MKQSIFICPNLEAQIYVKHGFLCWMQWEYSWRNQHFYSRNNFLTLSSESKEEGCILLLPLPFQNAPLSVGGSKARRRTGPRFWRLDSEVCPRTGSRSSDSTQGGSWRAAGPEALPMESHLVSFQHRLCEPQGTLGSAGSVACEGDWSFLCRNAMGNLQGSRAVTSKENLNRNQHNEKATSLYIQISQTY